MKKLKPILLLVAFPIIGAADSVIAYWDFGPNSAGYTELASINNTIDTPNLDVLDLENSYYSGGRSGVSFDDAEGGSHASGQALTWESGVNDGTNQWIMALNLTGYENIVLRWDYRSSISTGPDTAQLDYRIGSGSWSSLESLSFAKDSSYHEYKKDLSSISAINNQVAVEFRLSGFSGGSGGGTHRIDNLQVSAIPEPAVIGFISLTTLGVLMIRRLFLY